MSNKERTDAAVHGFLSNINNDVNDILTAALDSDKRAWAAGRILTQEISRDWQKLSKTLLDPSNEVKEVVHEALSRLSGRVFTIIDAFVPYKQRQANKDVAGRMVWQHESYLKAEMAKIRD